MAKHSNVNMSYPASIENPSVDLDICATGEGAFRSGVTTLNDEVELNLSGSSASDVRKNYPHVKSFCRWKKRKLLNIGTWNVRTLRQEGKLHLLQHELTQLNMNITGLAETR